MLGDLVLKSEQTELPEALLEALVRLPLLAFELLWARVIQLAMFRAVEDPDHDTQYHPAQEPNPALQGQAGHQGDTANSADDGQPRHTRTEELSGPIRFLIAKNYHTQANDYKSSQGADVAELGQLFDRQ